MSFVFQADLVNRDVAVQILNEAVLVGADLSGTGLGGTYLSGAYLSEADLSGSDLTGADLRGANPFEVNLEVAKYNDHTYWPEDFDPEEAGAIRAGTEE